MTLLRLAVRLTPLAACLLAPSGAGAAADEEDAAATLPTVIVTPDWRPVNAQTVPKSIAHVSGADLDAAGINHSIDLQYRVPGFVFRTNAVLGQPYLRGVGTEIISAGAESSVATFIDGAYMPRAYHTIVDFYDVERVEVLKGPQAVHLGRNVVGGAVSVHTRDPGAGAGGYVETTIGSYAERRIRAAADFPVAGTPVTFRLAGSGAVRDGYVDNVHLGIGENDEDYRAWRAKMRYAPSDSLDLVVSAERQREDSSRALGSQPMVGVGVNGGIANGGIVPADPREVTENTAPQIDIASARYGARLLWQRERFMLRSSTTYLETDALLALDLDGTNADFAANYPSGRSRSVTQELRATSAHGGPLDWTAGAFFLDEDGRQILDTRLPIDVTRSYPDAEIDTTSRAVFGEAGYRIGKWRARAGVRFNEDTRRIDLVRTVTSAAGTAVTTQQEERTWRAVTPELGVELAPRNGRLYYVSLARGHKPGGFNTSSVQPPFDSERLDAVEVGLKAALASGRLRVNAALFDYDYRDMQLDTPPADAALGTFPIVINAAEASLRGVDFEVTAALRSGSFVSLGAVWLDAVFDDFVSVDPNNPAIDPDRSGNRLPQAPRLSANARFEHAWPLAGGELALGVEYRRQSTMSFSLYSDPALEQRGYGLLNASVGYTAAGGRWYGELHARNLTDELYAETILRRDPLSGTKRFWGAPRTVGLRFGYRW
ncbi:MAG TPA: TonB-dependent receptor [Burkholderiales bacterium]